MAFDDVYRRPILEDEYRRDNNEINGILPFFGFKLKKDFDSEISTYGGNIEVKQVTSSTYQVSKTPTGFYNRHHYYKEYRRDKTAYIDYELESRVQAWLKANGFNDIYMTPYICPNTEEFHKRYGEGPLNRVYNIAALLCLALGGAITAAALMLGGSVTDILTTLLPNFDGESVKALPLVLGIVAAIGVIVAKYKHNKKHRAMPLKEQSPKYQKAIRERHFKGLVKLFGEDLGRAMQNFVIETEKHNLGKK